MSEVTQRLAGWLRSVELDPGATRQQAIEKAAVALTKDTHGRAVLDLVLLAHGQPSPDASRRVSEALHKEDETWGVRPGDLEASLTAATAAALAMEGDPEVAVPFALAVGSAAYGGLTPAVEELPPLARASLVKSSEALRVRDQLPVASPDVKGAFSELGELGAGEPVNSDHIAAVVKAAGTASSRVAAAGAKLVPALNRRFEAVEEELNLLWWVIGEFSELANRPFKRIPDHAAACLSGVELTSLLKRKCPLPSPRAILSRVLQGRSEQESDLARAVPATLELIGEEWVPEVEGHTLLPLVSSAREYFSLHHDALWKDSVESRWGIDPERATSNLDLAEQTNRELLFVSRE